MTIGSLNLSIESNKEEKEKNPSLRKENSQLYLSWRDQLLFSGHAGFAVQIRPLLR